MSRRASLVPPGPLLLAFIPLLAGVIRLTTLAIGVETPENARFFAAPLPVVDRRFESFLPSQARH